MTATSKVIKLQNVRLSFPNLWVPKAFEEGQKPRYEATFILDPSNDEHAGIIKQLRQAAFEVAKETYSGEMPKSVKMCFGNSDGTPVKVGPNGYRNDVKEYDGYEEMFYIGSANKTKPKVVDRARDDAGKFPLITEESGRVYGGCFVNGTITLWGQNNKFGKRINANLRAVQFVRDGEAFGVAPVDSDAEFDEVEIEEDFDAEEWDD